MIAHERFRKIVESVERGQKLSLRELEGVLQISPATLRRDLTELEALGKVVRIRGGVVHPGYFRGEPSFNQKMRDAAGVKRAIAKAAAQLVPERATVWVDAGSTCLELGALLLARRGVTILTHSLPLAMRACDNHEGAKLILIGGEVRAISGAAVGSHSLSWLRRLRADWCFLGASGLSAEEGASTTELSEAAMKEAILSRAKKRVLLADMRKWDEPATVVFAPWSKYDYWITGGSLDVKQRKLVEKAGPRVLVAA